MARPRPGGGWHSLAYAFRKAREAGGVLRLWRSLRSRNTCKTCALGMGGQRGGMVNEMGHFPAVCKKSIQAMVADMQPGISTAFWKQNPPQALRNWTSRELEAAGRLSEPVMYSRATDDFVPVSWETALGIIGKKLIATPADQSFWYLSGRSSNEASFLLQLFARLYGTNNVNNCSYYCHQASGVGLSSVIGSGTATIVLDDLEKADLVFVIGANPASNHPRLISSLLKVRRRGGRVIVINPIREPGLVRFKVPSDPRSFLFGSRIANHVIQPHIGGDLALLLGIAKKIVELRAQEETFLQDVCSGWPEFRLHLESLSWDQVQHESGVSIQEIETIAQVYAEATNVVFSWAMGITHHERGTENVQAIANLALIRGMIGRPGAGLMPIRGHSNVQGVGSVGVTPRLKKAIFERLESEYGLDLPEQVGRDTMSCMEGASNGDLSVGFCLGGNLYGSNPDSEFASRTLSNLELLVYVSTTLNTGHAWGLAKETIILPALARDEEPQATTQESMFNFVRLSDGGPRRFVGPRSEIDIVATLAESVLGDTTPIHWEDLRITGNIREMISSVVPGYEAIRDIDNTKEEFQIRGRTFHTPRFPTPDGRACLHLHALMPESTLGQNELRLMTIRSEGQFNTVVYEEHDHYRRITQRDVILIHPADLERLGLRDGDRVNVSGPAGEMTGIRATAFGDIRSGNSAMYFPEANRLLDRRVDEQSRTPSFKGARISISNSDPLGLSTATSEGAP